MSTMSSVAGRLPQPRVEYENAKSGWQIDRLIGANPVASINVALMMGAVVGWLLKQR